MRTDALERTLNLEKIEKKREVTADEMIEWHHQHNAHEFAQIPGDNEGQEILECCC